MYLDNLMHLIFEKYDILADGYNAIENKELYDSYDTDLHCYKISALLYNTHDDYQYYNDFLNIHQM